MFAVVGEVHAVDSARDDVDGSAGVSEAVNDVGADDVHPACACVHQRARASARSGHVLSVDASDGIKAFVLLVVLLVVCVLGVRGYRVVYAFERCVTRTVYGF